MNEKTKATVRRENTIAELVESMRIAQDRALMVYDPELEDLSSIPEPVVILRSGKIGVWKGGC